MTLLTIVLALVLQGAPASLEKDVRAYWEALEQGQKQQAARWVSEESYGHFLKRKEPVFRRCKIEDIARSGPGKARVTVSMQRWIGSGWFSWRLVESWTLTKSGWRVHIPDGVEARRALFRKNGSNTVPILTDSADMSSAGPGSLGVDSRLIKVLPRTVKFHTLSLDSPRSLLIVNGSREPLSVEKIEYQPELFSLWPPPGPIPAGGTARITLNYIGPASARESKARIVFTIKTVEEDLRTFEVEVRYNHVSPAAKALLGLTREDIEQQIKQESN